MGLCTGEKQHSIKIKLLNAVIDRDMIVKLTSFKETPFQHFLRISFPSLGKENALLEKRL